MANEWNEIQTIRKISPTFQIMAVLFFLEVHLTSTLFAVLVMSLLLVADMSPCVVQVLGFSNLALRDPWPTLERSLQAYTPSYSLILRYGLAATLWLCIGLLQVQLPLFTLYLLLPSLLFSPLPVFFEIRVKILSTSFEISFKS